MTTPIAREGATLSEHLSTPGVDDGLRRTLLALAEGCVAISKLVRRGPLAGALGAAVGENIQGEVQKALDSLSNDILIKALSAESDVAGVASEEMDHVLSLSPGGRHLVLFDPLDGSTNIDINSPIGTIASILRRPTPGEAVSEGEFLQKGRAQVAAAYALYGPQTTFCLTLGSGVVGFTLDPDTDAFVVTEKSIRISADASEFAINMSNQRHWAEPVQRYIADCLAGAAGPRGKDFNMRWVGAMVGDVHRVLQRGGVFLYPWDRREPGRAGKLRLLYEANPLGFLVEQAGGTVIDGVNSILDINPSALHQRVSVILGATSEVERLRALHAPEG